MTELYFSPKKTVEEIRESRKNIQYLGFPEYVRTSDTIKTVTLTKVDTTEGTEEYLVVFDLNFSRTAALLVQNEFQRQYPLDIVEYDDIMDYDGKYHSALIWTREIGEN